MRQAKRSKHVDAGKQTNETNRAADRDEGSGFVGGNFMPEDEEIARFGETLFGRGDVTVPGVTYEGRKGLWDILT
jgi:hypothetical protein